MSDGRQAPEGGMFAAALTLFKDSEAVDYDAWKIYIAWLCASDLDGVLIQGTTGEFPLMTFQERFHAILHAKEVVPRTKRLAVNVGAMTTAEAVSLATAAGSEPRPAEMLLCGPPYYYQITLTPERLRTHLRAVREAGQGAPVLFYHIPRMSFVAPKPEVLSEIISDVGICGIKDSDGDLSFQDALRPLQPPQQFTYFTGSLPATLQSWERGGDGGILGLAAVMPNECAALWRLHRAGGGEEAKALHARLSEVWKVISPFGIAGIRDALRHTMPEPFGEFAQLPGRRPFGKVSESDQERIRAVLTSQTVSSST